MPLKNYTDISTSYAAANAGFQFEFQCANCPTSWKSPMQPYKRGRIVGLLYGLGYVLGNTRGPEALSRRIADSGADAAKQEALAEAQQRATARFTECEECHKAYCADCLDERSGLCHSCSGRQRNGHASGSSYGGGSASASAGGGNSPSCPNCGTAGNGGRFCAECGFDMASTHKSCPQCGAMAERGARFCTDCGHGY